jgi:hypothetical protein
VFNNQQGSKIKSLMEWFVVDFREMGDLLPILRVAFVLSEHILGIADDTIWKRKIDEKHAEW